MPNRYIKTANITLYPNSDGKATHGNSNWKPYKDGSPADITLRKDSKYSVKLFANDDGTLGLSMTEVVIEGSVPDGGSGSIKSLSETIEPPKSPIAAMADDGLSDDEIPF